MAGFGKHSTATVASVALHVVIAGFLVLGFRISPRPSASPHPAPIEAVVVDEAAMQREIKRLESQEQAEIEQRRDEERQAREAAETARLEREREQERLAELQREREREEAEQVRVAELQAQRQREEAEREATAEAERVRLAELERERVAEERRLAEEARQREEAERVARERAAAEERRRQEEARKQAELEAQLADALAAENEARLARESGLLDEYIRNIQNQIQQRWIRPPSAGPGLECVVNVTQIISGDVTSVSIGRCNGDEAVIRSIEAAVYRASPLPRPPVPSLFNRNLAITFRPDN